MSLKPQAKILIEMYDGKDVFKQVRAVVNGTDQIHTVIREQKEYIWIYIPSLGFSRWWLMEFIIKELTEEEYELQRILDCL